MSLRTVENLNGVIDSYLKRNNIFYEDAPWQIRESSLGGFGVFAKRNIEVGELIFLDSPVILGPRCVDGLQEFCVNCFDVKNLKRCRNNCGLSLCSDLCQNSFDHQRECKLIRLMSTKKLVESESLKLLKCLTPLRSLLLSEEDKDTIKHLKYHRGKNHGHEIDTLVDELSFEIKEDEKHFLKFVCSVLDANAFEVITGSEENQSGLRGRNYFSIYLCNL